MHQDTANQLTGLGYFWSDYTLRNSLTYGYDNGGNVATCDQGWYKTTYGYDGADQLTSETSTGGSAPASQGYTYDHNANRLTQTTNGSLIQNFAYDAHDKLTSGTLNAETDGYDANGNKTGLSFGGLFYGYTYDDEDRLVKATYPGQINTYTYNGLGLRVGMTDSAGVHTYLCDGTSPGSPVLSDGFAVYTPGLSEHRNGASLYYANDQLGNLWTVDGTSKNQLYYQDTTGFGTLTANAGAGTTPFKFGGGNGCQTDADTQMVLMGHRYYDARTGRFLSQDHAGAGNNWYAYCENNPTNSVDPRGNVPQTVNGGSASIGGPMYAAAQLAGFDNSLNADFADSEVMYAALEAAQPLPGSSVISTDAPVQGEGLGGQQIADATVDSVGNLIQLIAPFLKGDDKIIAGDLATLAATASSAKGAIAGWNAYSYLTGEAQAFSVFDPAISYSYAARAGIALGGTALGTTAAIAGAGLFGWQIGTSISNLHLGPGGQTVSSFWGNYFSGNVGPWMQQHTSFGH